MGVTMAFSIIACRRLLFSPNPPLPLPASSPALHLSHPSIFHSASRFRSPPSSTLLFSPTFCTSAVSVDSPLSTSPETSQPELSELDALDIRVGKIIRAWKHPEADSLYVEEVDVGEPAGPRTICSGLVKYVPEQELQDRAVVVLANLKPRNMRGVKSNGMLLAASDASHENVELLEPPQGSIPGERVWFGSESDGVKQGDPATPNQVQKKKTWETIQPHLKTTEECIATFKGISMRTSAGLVTCKTLRGANIA